MMSCLRERARFSSPMDSAIFTSSWIGLAFSSVRFIELRDCVSSAGLMISESSASNGSGSCIISSGRPPPLLPRLPSRLPWRGPLLGRLRP